MINPTDADKARAHQIHFLVIHRDGQKATRQQAINDIVVHLQEVRAEERHNNSGLDGEIASTAFLRRLEGKWEAHEQLAAAVAALGDGETKGARIWFDRVLWGDVLTALAAIQDGGADE